MIKIKGLVAEDLNGFMDEGTEFRRAALPRHLPHRRPAEGPGRLRQHADRGRVAATWRPTSTAAWSPSAARCGRVQGRQRIELLAGSRVQATLVSPRLVIEEGAFFQGECEMAPREAEAGPVAAGPWPVPPDRT